MNTLQINDTIGSVVARYPVLAQAFERSGVDYCCGGKKTLHQVCQDKSLEPESFLTMLEQSLAMANQEPCVDAGAMSLTALANHIEQTHHAYLRSELPRLDKMTRKVADVHGKEEPRLYQIRQTFLGLAEEMFSHMLKEEQILFPMIRKLEASATLPAFHCGSVANPIRQMELEHDHAGAALEAIRKLTDDYVPPTWACNTYRAMLDSFSRLERDMHQHVHKENNVLFPRAIILETKHSPQI